LLGPPPNEGPQVWKPCAELGNVDRADVVTATVLLPVGLAVNVLGFVAVVDGRVAGIRVDIRDFNAAVLEPSPNAVEVDEVRQFQ